MSDERASWASLPEIDEVAVKKAGEAAAEDLLSPEKQALAARAKLVAEDIASSINSLRTAHIAGLKEALTLVDKERSEIGVVGDGVGDIICDHLTVAIRARIKQLEDQNG